MPEFKPGDCLDEGRIEILEEIGHGSSGTVYKAKFKPTEKIVAVKLNDKNSQTFLEGAKIQAKLSEAVSDSAKDMIVKVHDIKTDKNSGSEYFVMDYYQSTLADLIKKGPIDYQLSVELAKDLAYTMMHIHAQGIVHSDIKPSNILVKQTGPDSFLPLLSDFGLAKKIQPYQDKKRHEKNPTAQDLSNSMQDTLTQEGKKGIGTLYYHAPETLNGEYDDRSDIYSLGVVLYKMLTRGLPNGISPPSKKNPSIPKELDTICEKALEPNPRDRYQDMCGFLDALLDFNLRQQMREESIYSKFLGLIGGIYGKTVEWLYKNKYKNKAEFLAKQNKELHLKNKKLTDLMLESVGIDLLDLHYICDTPEEENKLIEDFSFKMDLAWTYLKSLLVATREITGEDIITNEEFNAILQVPGREARKAEMAKMISPRFKEQIRKKFRPAEEYDRLLQDLALEQNKKGRLLKCLSHCILDLNKAKAGLAAAEQLNKVTDQLNKEFEAIITALETQKNESDKKYSDLLTHSDEKLSSMNINLKSLEEKLAQSESKLAAANEKCTTLQNSQAEGLTELGAAAKEAVDRLRRILLPDGGE